MSEPVAFRPAKPRATNALGGFAGGTGSGKTYSALLVATGLAAVTGGRIALIDTERGRALHYARHFNFEHGDLVAPYTPERYMAAIEAARKHAGPGGVVIVDSMSHEWEGEGGLLETANNRAQEFAKKFGGSPDAYTFMSWRDPKERHQKELVSRILQLDCHLLLCFRAKEKMKMRKIVERGREVSKPVSIGVQPITDDAFGFELTYFCVFDQSNPGVPVWSHKALMKDLLPVFHEGERITAETGKRLAAWAGGTPEPARKVEARFWVDRDGVAVNYPHERISSAVQEFNDLWFQDKDLYTHHGNLNILKDYFGKIPDGPLKNACRDIMDEMGDILAKEAEGDVESGL